MEEYIAYQLTGRRFGPQ